MSGPPAPGRRVLDTGLVFAGQLLGLGLSFLAGLLAARLFSPAERGEYAMLTTTAAFVSVLAGFGFAESIVYFYRRGEADVERSATAIVLMDGLVALLALAAAALFGPWLASRYFPSGGLAAAWLATGAGVLGILTRNGVVFLQARGDFLRASAAGVLQPALFVAALAAIGASGAGFAQAFPAFLVSFALPAALLLAPLLRKARAAALDGAHLARVARFSAKSYANVALGQLNYRLDLFLIGALLPDLARLADYHIASTLAGLIWMLPDAYATALYPRLAGLPTERDRSAETLRAVRVLLLPVLALALGLAAVAPWLVPWVFGARYAGAVPLTLLLLPGVVCMSVAKLLSRYFLSGNRHQLAAFAMCAGVVIDVAVLLWALPRWGIAAASVAASAAYAGTLLFSGAAFWAGAELRRDDLRAFPGREIRVYRSGVRMAWAWIASAGRGRPFE